MCPLWQYVSRSSHRAESRRQFVDQRHLQSRSQSHDLVPGGGHTAKNVPRTCPLDASALSSTNETSEWHAQHLRLPRRNRQHARNGHQREPRVHQEGRQLGRGGAANPKAAPTNRQSNQARRRVQRLDDSGGQAQRNTSRSAQEPQQNLAQGHPRDASDDARPIIGVGSSGDQGVQPRRQTQTQTYAEKVRQEVRGRTRGPPFVWAYVGLIMSLQQRGQHGRHANGTRAYRRTGPIGTHLAKPNLRRGSILQAGQNVQSGYQENHTEYRVARETVARSRSTQSNQGRAQVRTSTAHGHGTRATRVLGRYDEDVNIMVKAFFTERGVQANSKAWHNATQSEHIQRTAIAHAQRPK